MSRFIALLVTAILIHAGAHVPAFAGQHGLMLRNGETRSSYDDVFRNEVHKFQCTERQPVIEYYHLGGLEYMFFSEKLTWEEAHLRCLTYDGKLAVLDDAEKAVAVAKTMAESNIGAGDKWVGGRRIDGIWRWVEPENEFGDIQAISTSNDTEGYPPWSRTPLRPFKECLGIDRRAHDSPSFVDLDCRLQRSFVCQKLNDDNSMHPSPSKWIQTRGSLFALYRAKFTWEEAASFCGSRGARLAVVKNNNVVNILAYSMTKTRPDDFENCWIGARHSYGRWAWLSTGAALNTVTEKNGYPPWRYGRPEHNVGCLLLDRHLENRPSFIEMPCDKRRNFICEEYEDDTDDWLNDPVKFRHDNLTYVIYPEGRTWNESQQFCLQQGSTLAWLDNMNDTNAIIDAMSDHPKAISHVWLGGRRATGTNEWIWSHDGQKIPTRQDKNGFPPWSNMDNGYDFYDHESTCLNLDRSNHVSSHLYGLDCDTKQPFVCTVACEMPPPAKHGQWRCGVSLPNSTPMIKECWLSCDPDHLILGSPNVSCSAETGWSSTQQWLEFPTCHGGNSYAKWMLKMMGHEMKRSVGYYLLIDTTDQFMRQLSINLAEQIQRNFPISSNLKMGILSLVSTPPIFAPFGQTNACQMLAVTEFSRQRVTNDSYNVTSVHIYDELLPSSNQNTHIIAILDSTRGRTYKDFLQRLKDDGQRVTVISHPEDQEFLHSFATSGYQRKSNMFLLTNTELVTLVKELARLDRHLIKCDSTSQLENNASAFDAFRNGIVEPMNDPESNLHSSIDVGGLDVPSNDPIATKIVLTTNGPKLFPPRSTESSKSATSSNVSRRPKSTTVRYSPLTPSKLDGQILTDEETAITPYSTNVESGPEDNRFVTKSDASVDTNAREPEPNVNYKLGRTDSTIAAATTTVIESESTMATGLSSSQEQITTVQPKSTSLVEISNPETTVEANIRPDTNRTENSPYKSANETKDSSNGTRTSSHSANVSSESFTSSTSSRNSTPIPVDVAKQRRG